MAQERVTANAEIDGAVMRELRKLAGLSVRALAAKVGCTHPYISMLETRTDRTCSPEIFVKICDALRLEDRSVLLRKPGARSAA